MKALILGPGWLGAKFHDYFDGSVLSQADITDYQAVVAEIEQHKPDVVINTAGKTGRPHIDWCEDHKLETVSSNTMGPQALLKACGEREVKLVHISSGCIYAGDNDGKGWSEEDEPNFYGSFYSRTKIWAELALREFPALIVRIRMPFDDRPSERNLLNKLLKYDKVISEQNAITVVSDLLDATKALIEQKAEGIYNVTNPGSITHPEVLDMYKEIVDPEHKYEVISTDELETSLVKAARSNCVLNTDKLAAAGIELLPVRDAVRGALERYKENSK